MFSKSALKPLTAEYLIILSGMKMLVMIFCVFCLMAVSVNAAVVSHQPILNYKQQLQYQMQQRDKFEYQQHINQQQQYYQQQYQQQQQAPTKMAFLHQEQQHHQPYLAVKPTQILQTAASLIIDDGIHQSEALALGQADYSKINAQRRRPGNRKRKRRPQPMISDDDDGGPTASNSPPYWRGQIEDDKEVLSMVVKQTINKAPETDEASRLSLQSSFKRRKQSTIREPMVALEKEQKLYELRNKPETLTSAFTNNRNSADLKNILKNSGGLSLSEILQQKNISLDDLLKGKQNALQALQTTAPAPLEKMANIKYPSLKSNFKTSAPSVKLTDIDGSNDEHNSRERSKLNTLHRLKLFGSSSRPSGLQVGLVDYLTTRKRDSSLYKTNTTTTITITTHKPSTTKIPLYKKIFHQRPTLKPIFLLKNTAVIDGTGPKKITSWDSQESEQDKESEDIKAIDNEEIGFKEDNNGEDEYKFDEILEKTTWEMDTTIAPTITSSTTTTTTSTMKPITGKIPSRDINTSARRMYTSTRGIGRTTYRYTSTTSTPPTTTKPTTTTTTTTTTSTTTTPLPMTTTTTTSTTTASSSTMNLTPKANLNLNTEDIRERIQETLLKNLIEKEKSFKKLPIASENLDTDDDLENFFEETIKPKTTKVYESSTITTRMKQFSPMYSTASSTSTTTLTPAVYATSVTENLDVIPDFDNVDDRTDLLELIEDRRSGNRLFKVLEQRNMTLEELIEHRKRGSSQLHLATIMESPSRFYPDKKVVLQDNMDIVTAFENFPHFNLLNLKSVKPDDIKTDSQGSSYFTSIIDIEPTDEVSKNRKGQILTSIELDKASLLPDRLEKSVGFFPSWKTLALASLTTTNNKHKDANPMRNKNLDNSFYLQQPKMLLENNSEDYIVNEDENLYDIKDNELVIISHDDDAGENNDYQAQNPIQAAVRSRDRTAEAIENEVARAHDLVDLELSGHGFKRNPPTGGALAHSYHHSTFYTNIPAGIKSALVASATIVLTALVTFMVIFIICRWKQRQHRMTNIMKAYNAMKNKMPTIATTSTTTAATEMAPLATVTTSSTTNPNSRRSSFRDMCDLLGTNGLSVAATIKTSSTGMPNSTTTTTAITSSPSPPLNASQTATLLVGNNCNKNVHMYNQSQNNGSLLFQRPLNQNPNNIISNSNNDNPTNLAILSGCNLLDIKRNKMNGSTTSLSFSLSSGHNIPNTHINTMDANSHEVQEYLFDTLRNSF